MKPGTDHVFPPRGSRKTWSVPDLSFVRLLAPEFFEPRIAAASGAVELLAHVVLLVVILVIVLRGPEFGGRGDLGHDRTLERLGLLQLRARLLGQPFLFGREVVDAAAVLGAGVAELAILRGRVDVVPENVEQFRVG